MRAHFVRRSLRNQFRYALRQPPRQLATELLERRDLLAVVTIDNTWRADDFTVTGNYNYIYTLPSLKYVDRVPSGTINIEQGHIEFTSPTQGQWSADAKVTGNGTSTNNGQSCASYSAVHIGKMSGEYKSGQLTGTDSSPTSSSYPTHTGPCPVPTDPTDYSPFTSELATLLSGTYDETKYQAGFNWNGPYQGGSISITIPPSPIKYTNTTPTDLAVTAKITNAGLEIVGTVEGKHLTPGPNGLDKAVTDIRLFYTTATSPDTVVGSVTLDKPIDVFWNLLKTEATVTELGNPPPTARYLMIQIDRNDVVAENANNNTVFLPLNDIQLLSFEGGNANEGRAANQLALKYKIERPTNDPQDDKPFEIQIVGSSTTSSSGIGKVIHSFTLSPSTLSGGALSLLNEPASNALRAGTHTLIINTAALNLGADFGDHDHEYILAVADRDNEVIEVDSHPLDEDNLTVFSGFIQDSAGDIAVLRTASAANDEVVITQSSAVSVNWEGHYSINFNNPSEVVVITSGGNDSIKAVESSQLVTAPLRIYGDEGDDKIVGGSGSDTLEGGAGDDVVIGGRDDDTLYGGPGKGDDVLLGDGYQLTGASLDDLIKALDGYLSSSTLDFNFQLVPLPGGKDTIQAGDGDSLIMGGLGSDNITGGTGLSLIFSGSLETSTASAKFDVSNARDSFNEALKVLAKMIDGIQINDTGINTIIGGSGPNLIIGSGPVNHITGGDGPIDILIGNDGPDIIDGKQGFNFIVGGDDSDELRGGDDGNLIFGDAVKLAGLNFDIQKLLQFKLLDVISLPSIELSGVGGDQIYGGAGFDFIVGGNGSDTITGGNGTNIAFGDEISLNVGGLIGVLMDFGGFAADVAQIPITNVAGATKALYSLYGVWDKLWDQLIGNNDRQKDDYYGGSGTDIVFGGGGDDFLVGGDGYDFLVGGWGNDEFQTNPQKPIVEDNIIDDFAFGGLGNDTFHGGPGTDYLASTFGSDTFFGNDGDDIIVTGDGDDAAFGGNGNDMFEGGQGDDAFVGGAGTDTFSDSAGNNVLLQGDAIVVSTLDDESDSTNGTTSLREAISLANASSGVDAIVFSEGLTSNVVPGFPVLITLTEGALPQVNESLLILGPGASLLGIDGNGLAIPFTVSSGATLSVRRLLLTNFDMGVDYGDAPTSAQSGFSNSYATLIEDDGAAHRIGAWYLGSSIDAELQGLPDVQAGRGTSGGDDHDGQADEDGVRSLVPALQINNADTISSFVVWASLSGKLDVWIDFNRNGTFDHPDELLSGGSMDVDAGPNVISFPISKGLAAGDTFARFRFTANGATTPNGQGDVGEVEDSVIRLVAPSARTEVNLPPAELGPNELSTLQGTTTFQNSEGNVWFGAPTSASAQLTIVGTNSADTLHIESNASGSQWQTQLGQGDDIVELDVLDFGRINGEAGIDKVRLIGDSLHLNLTTLPSGSLESIESIDLRGLNTQITLNPATIATVTNGSKVLELIAARSDTRFNIGTGWTLTSGVINDRGFHHEATKDGSTLLISNLLPWQNPLNAFDVSRDSFVSAFDALLLVNTLNTEFSRRLIDPGLNDQMPSFYFDVNGDSSVSPIDALFVINFLNTNPLREGESQTVAEFVPANAPAATDNIVAQSFVPPPQIVANNNLLRSQNSSSDPVSAIELALSDLCDISMPKTPLSPNTQGSPYLNWHTEESSHNAPHSDPLNEELEELVQVLAHDPLSSVL